MLATSAYMIVFRIIRVLAGVVWVGGVFLLVAYIQPSARSLGPAGGPFMQELLARRKLPIFLLSAGGVTIAAGLFLYWRDWQAVGSLGDWVATSYGAGLTIGAVAAVAGFLVGLLGVKPTMEKMLPLAAQLASGGAPPPPEMAAEVQALQLRARRLAIIVLALLVLATLAMATARYW
jgi:uncharacterized membrane protein